MPKEKKVSKQKSKKPEKAKKTKKVKEKRRLPPIVYHSFSVAGIEGVVSKKFKLTKTLQ